MPMPMFGALRPLDFLCGLRARVEGLGPWPGRGVAFVLGVLAVFSMPPLYQIYLLVPAFSGLLWLAAAQPSRWRAFAIGWWFGAGFFAAGLYWVSFALLVEADKFAWLMPFAIFGFAFGLGLFCAVAALAVRMVPGDLTAKALVLAGAWTVMEWLRSWLLTGFPWNPMGSAWLFSDTLAQGAEKNKSSAVLVGFVAALVVALALGGQHRLANATDDVVADVRLRLVQPNIRQAEKWQADRREDHMRNQLELSTLPPAAGTAPPTHVIWAETAAPFFIAGHAAWRRYVGKHVPPGGLMITGAPRVVSSDDKTGLKVANSLLAIDGAGDIRATFDKFHLVPFGEYVPLSEWLPLERITQGAGAFTPGPGPQTLDLQGLPPVSPLICYEIIFPGQVTDGTGRAQWLLNLTNDGWYGARCARGACGGDGNLRHYRCLRPRAVESRIGRKRLYRRGLTQASITALGLCPLRRRASAAVRHDCTRSRVRLGSWARRQYAGISHV